MRRWRDEQDEYWKATIRQRLAQDRHMWKQHAEAFSKSRDITVTNEVCVGRVFVKTRWRSLTEHPSESNRGSSSHLPPSEP